MSGVVPTVEKAALRFLAQRDRTAAQLQAFLLRKGAEKRQVATLLRRFRKLGYVDDEAFAVHWSQSRLQRFPMGRQRLIEEMCAQGIDRGQAERVAAPLFQGASELEYARQVLRRRLPHLARGQERKAIVFLRRRGFEEEVIQKVILQQVVALPD